MAIAVEQLRERFTPDSELLPFDSVVPIVRRRINGVLAGLTTDPILVLRGGNKCEELFFDRNTFTGRRREYQLVGIVGKKTLHDAALAAMREYGMDESNFSVIFDDSDSGVHREVRDYPASTGHTIFTRVLESDSSDPNTHYSVVWTVRRSTGELPTR